MGTPFAPVTASQQPPRYPIPSILIHTVLSHSDYYSDTFAGGNTDGASRCPHLAALYGNKPVDRDVQVTEVHTDSMLETIRNGVARLFYGAMNWFWPEPNPAIPVVHLDVSHMGALHAMGPEQLMHRLAIQSNELVVKFQIGTKWITVVKGRDTARELLNLSAHQIGRGDAFAAFTALIGPVFFSKDNDRVIPDRNRFKISVQRSEINFQRIQLHAHAIIASLKAQGEHPDFMALVVQYTMGAIAKCFVGIKDTDKIPSDAFLIFLEAGKQITHASIDPVSVLTTPMVRADFRDIKLRMDALFDQIIRDHLDAICEGDNYIWDLAVSRAEQLRPGERFFHIKAYDAKDQDSVFIRTLIATDRWVRETGPTTLFASMNISRSLYFMLEMLNANPDIWNNICNEVHTAGTVACVKDIKDTQMPFLNATVLEALWHLTPIPMMPREILQDVDIVLPMVSGDVPAHFRRGDMLLLMFKELQGGALTTGFDPSAWLNGSKLRDLWAFGQGARACPAKPFAIQVMKQFLLEMVQQGVRIAPAVPATYTTGFGGVGPKYDPTAPIPAVINA